MTRHAPASPPQEPRQTRIGLALWLALVLAVGLPKAFLGRLRVRIGYALIGIGARIAADGWLIDPPPGMEARILAALERDARGCGERGGAT